jgi:hypothetical protein
MCGGCDVIRRSLSEGGFRSQTLSEHKAVGFGKLGHKEAGYATQSANVDISTVDVARLHVGAEAAAR